jgi:hypothetical protein
MLKYVIYRRLDVTSILPIGDASIFPCYYFLSRLFILSGRDMVGKLCGELRLGHLKPDY